MGYMIHDTEDARKLLQTLIGDLSEGVFDLEDPTDFKAAQELWQKLQGVPDALKAAGVDFPTVLARAKEWLLSLEKIMEGQRSLFVAGVISPGTVVKQAQVSPELRRVFDSIYNTLGKYEDLAEEETSDLARRMVTKPSAPSSPRAPSRPRGPKPSKTYAQAQKEILDLLQREGWKVSAGLKVPHATSPDGKVRLWFKAQAIYYTKGSHNMSLARSLWADDIRMESAEQALRKIFQKLGI